MLEQIQFVEAGGIVDQYPQRASVDVIETAVLFECGREQLGPGLREEPEFFLSRFDDAVDVALDGVAEPAEAVGPGGCLVDTLQFLVVPGVHDYTVTGITT